jgi:hypothetical protein
MARIVDPTLADVRWESGRPTWLGYVALARALAAHAVASTPRAIAHAYMDDDRAIPRAALFSVLAALLAAVPLIMLPLVGAMRYLHAQPTTTHQPMLPIRLLLVLVPQALAVAAPAGLLLGIPVAFRNRRAGPRRTRRAIALAAVHAAALAILIAWGVPHGNQRFRVLVSGNPHLRPGPNEMGFSALREDIETLNLTPGGRLAARPLEFLYQIRMALICAPLPFGVLALALAATAKGRRRPWLIGVVATTGYVVIFFPAVLALEQLALHSALPPSLLAWLPTAAVTAVAMVMHHRSGRLQPEVLT